MLIEKCENCGSGFEQNEIEYDGRILFRQKYCFDCAESLYREKEEQEKVRTAEESTKRAQEAFCAICPPLYRETDWARVADSMKIMAEEWQFSPVGIGFVGIAGKGKTRAAYRIIQRMLFEGRSCDAITSPEFSRLCVDQFSDDKSRKGEATSRIRRLYRCSVFFLDDLGKQKMTDRAEMELYSVLEHRTSHLLPTIWTANAKSKTLLQMFSEDRGEPIMRRLTDFSRICADWKDSNTTTHTHTTNE